MYAFLVVEIFWIQLKQLQFNKELQNIDSALLCPLKLLQDWSAGLENYYNECQVHEAS